MKTGRPLLLPERLDTLDLASIMEIENSLSSFTSNNKKFYWHTQIRQSLFRQRLFCSGFAKVATHQCFPLYGNFLVLSSVSSLSHKREATAN